MQEANSDVFCIGRRVNSYYYNEWKAMEWKKIYPKIPIETKVTVKIVSQGLTN